MQTQFKYFYEESFVRMRHKCAVEAKITAKNKQEFKDLFISKWEQAMDYQKTQFEAAGQIVNFKKFYHPGDLAYQFLKLDALKLIKQLPLNQIKQSVWTHTFQSKLPKHFRYSDSNDLHKSNLQKTQFKHKVQNKNSQKQKN